MYLIDRFPQSSSDLDNILENREPAGAGTGEGSRPHLGPTGSPRTAP